MVRGQRNPLHLTLGERLKRARLAAAILPAHLSRAVGLSVNSVAAIERGRVPGADVVERLARGLRCSPCALAFGIDVPYVEEPEGAPLRCLGIGERLRAAREERGMGLRELARATGPTPDGDPALTPGGVGSVESGRTVPSVATVERLAAALKISPCFLAFAEGPADGPRFPPPVRRPRKPPAPRTRARKATPRPAGRATSSSSRKPAARARAK